MKILHDFFLDFLYFGTQFHLDMCQSCYYIAGAIPVVIGAPNIQDFAPCDGCILHIKEVKDIASVAKTMQYLATNPDAFNNTLR